MAKDLSAYREVHQLGLGIRKSPESQLVLRAGGFSPAYIILVQRCRLPRHRHRVFRDRKVGGRLSTSRAVRC